MSPRLVNGTDGLITHLNRLADSNSYRCSAIERDFSLAMKIRKHRYFFLPQKREIDVYRPDQTRRSENGRAVTKASSLEGRDSFKLQVTLISYNI